MTAARGKDKTLTFAVRMSLLHDLDKKSEYKGKLVLKYGIQIWVLS
jgi:hypothetical protein